MELEWWGYNLKSSNKQKSDSTLAFEIGMCTAQKPRTPKGASSKRGLGGVQ
jgi:hypothetical protein